MVSPSPIIPARVPPIPNSVPSRMKNSWYSLLPIQFRFLLIGVFSRGASGGGLKYIGVGLSTGVKKEVCPCGLSAVTYPAPTLIAVGGASAAVIREPAAHRAATRARRG